MSVVPSPDMFDSESQPIDEAEAMRKITQELLDLHVEERDIHDAINHLSVDPNSVYTLDTPTDHITIIRTPNGDFLARPKPLSK